MRKQRRLCADILRTACAAIGLAAAGQLRAQSSLDQLFAPSDAESRAITAENSTGAKGHGGMATEGYGKVAARGIGPGWKVCPAISISPVKTATLADVDGPAIIRHIWMTPGMAVPATWRSMIVRIYWDGEASPLGRGTARGFLCDGAGRGRSREIGGNCCQC